MRLTTALGATAWLILETAQLGVAVAGEIVPSRFEADTVYVTLPVARGGSVELYTDTGGGGFVLSERAASRLGLQVGTPSDAALSAELGAEARVARFPQVAGKLPKLPAQAIVVPRAAQIPAWPEQGDGVVGASWFAGGVWTWDYPGRHLVHERSNWKPPADARTVPVAFKIDRDGSRPTNFARLQVVIDGRELSLLLDTGAETFLTDDAVQRIGGGPQLRATSMIAASVFDQWRNAHPDWQFIDNAQVATGASMIKVPSVEIAGFHTGPVWFTRRPDKNFHEFMSSMMDARVEGALGGNAFRTFVMTVDYPRARVSFACRADC
ncbi:hypothetical protein [Roseiterribacter gracilis]|uniref:Peptidase A2 domain-containing protein n=1 Tax=Roseiterribacter gracilis TaxID=2812848 RepID=A0A8S8XBY9_9PROT|nr:hypothetical protein TMPK1_10520 [Rhodospirillales bacterium TMPK1]